MEEVAKIEMEFSFQSEWLDLFLNSHCEFPADGSFPLLPTKLPPLLDSGNIQEWLDEARNCLEIRRQWLKYLQQGKIILELLPERLALEIVQKMETRTFSTSQRSTKWLTELIKLCRKKYLKYVKSTLYIQPLEDQSKIEEYRKFIAQRDGFRFSEINICALLEGIYFEEIVKCFEGKRIFADELYFCGYDFPAKFSKIFRQKKLTLFYCRTELDQLSFPKEMKELEMRYYRGDLANAVKVLGNQNFQVNWELHHVKRNQLITIVDTYIEVLKKTSRPGNIFFDLGPLSFDITTVFNGESQPNFYFFTSCVEKKNETISKYRIRLENTQSGELVGVICYWEEGQEAVSSLHCDFFKTMEEFLSAYEMYIGKYRELEEDDMNLKEIEKLFRISL